MLCVKLLYFYFLPNRNYSYPWKEKEKKNGKHKKKENPSKTRRRNLSFWSIFGADRRALLSLPLRSWFSIFKESGRTLGGHYRLGEQWKLNMNNGRGSCRDKHDLLWTNSWPMMHGAANPSRSLLFPEVLLGCKILKGISRIYRHEYKTVACGQFFISTF